MIFATVTILEELKTVALKIQLSMLPTLQQGQNE
jgi:hypothetical protein